MYELELIVILAFCFREFNESEDILPREAFVKDECEMVKEAVSLQKITIIPMAFGIDNNIIPALADHNHGFVFLRLGCVGVCWGCVGSGWHCARFVPVCLASIGFMRH